MKNKLLSLGESTIKELENISSTLSMNQSTCVKISIALLYNKMQSYSKLSEVIKND
jgi:hypothetical protein